MALDRREFLEALAVGSLLAGCASREASVSRPVPAQGAPPEEIRFADTGRCSFGEWRTEARLSPARWQPRSVLTLDLSVTLSPSVLSAIRSLDRGIESLVVLITSERCFDPQGWLRLPGDERMSTLLTPTGLAIEGGTSGAISQTVGDRHLNPVDRLISAPLTELAPAPIGETARLHTEIVLPNDIPPGVYRLRFDLGVANRSRRFSLNRRQPFGGRAQDSAEASLVYSPPVPCSGVGVDGRFVDATVIPRRIYWVLLDQYNSNGYRGVVAEEDEGHFALSPRNIIPDQVILPLFNERGGRMRYNLEPAFAADLIDPQRNIPWDYSSGQLAIRVTDPTGSTVDLGMASYTGMRGPGATTNNPRFTAWTPMVYGRHTVEARGWIADRWGNRYAGGGTYHFWIAKRMTMATATFQGMSFPVGSSYGREIAFIPAVPAAVSVRVDLYPHSRTADVRTRAYGGQASLTGVFGMAQGLQPVLFDLPGEYHARIQATHTDADGHLWVCAMRHVGVVSPEDGRLIAHGKKLQVGAQFVDRGDTHAEGFEAPNDEFSNLEHINFPYRSGDALLIASEGQGANKIEPVLTYEIPGETPPNDRSLHPIGASNVQITTRNGMSPHLYPEYIADWAYYYAAAPRPGFSSRFLVGEHGVRAPYWPTSRTNFGGQIGASNNGDSPGDIYRLLGGVVLRRASEPPRCAGYLASAFILPKGSRNNRVIAPGAEPLVGADGTSARFFLVAARPGSVYEAGAVFVPFVQIDPILPARVRFRLRFPNGRQEAVDGIADRFGAFIGQARWGLDQPGVYVYTLTADWNGHAGRMPGLPQEGGFLFVIETKRPGGSPGLRLTLPGQLTFPVERGLVIEGVTTGDAVYYAAVTPGAVVDQGRLEVQGGRFQYRFDPEAIHQRIPIYDVQNLRTGRKETGRVIHLTFFTQEQNGAHAFARVILRGTTAIYARPGPVS